MFHELLKKNTLSFFYGSSKYEYINAERVSMISIYPKSIFELFTDIHPGLPLPPGVY